MAAYGAAGVAAFQVLNNCLEESDALLPGQFPDALGVAEYYRTRALLAEKSRQAAISYDCKCAWEDIAIEWHALANRAAHEADRRKL